MSVTMQNFVDIGQITAEISRFFISKTAAVRRFDFKKFNLKFLVASESGEPICIITPPAILKFYNFEFLNSR